MHVRGRYVDLAMPNLCFYGPIAVAFHRDTHVHRLMEPEIWFGDEYQPIRMRRIRIDKATYLVFHTGNLTYDMNTLGRPDFKGRAIVLRESTRSPYPPVNMRKDADSAAKAVKRLTKKARQDIPDLPPEYIPHAAQNGLSDRQRSSAQDAANRYTMNLMASSTMDPVIRTFLYKSSVPVLTLFPTFIMPSPSKPQTVKAYHISFDKPWTSRYTKVIATYNPHNYTGKLLEDHKWFPRTEEIRTSLICSDEGKRPSTFLVFHTNTLSCFFDEDFQAHYRGYALITRISSRVRGRLVNMRQKDSTIVLPLLKAATPVTAFESLSLDELTSESYWESGSDDTDASHSTVHPDTADTITTLAGLPESEDDETVSTTATVATGDGPDYDMISISLWSSIPTTRSEQGEGGTGSVSGFGPRRRLTSIPRRDTAGMSGPTGMRRFPALSESPDNKPFPEPVSQVEDSGGGMGMLENRFDRMEERQKRIEELLTHLTASLRR
ncbi:hypothetical protein NM688_g114 [Phlebia brevispora]|uniref:Uncharacterized protein n=1 Tax=Phlebia brevispora TaxID=194682 RepID=A0ACC1TF86_9APHY|nr:hypothetical protein NM688_g114 [Phlebia brevispora]